MTILKYQQHLNKLWQEPQVKPLTAKERNLVKDRHCFLFRNIECVSFLLFWVEIIYMSIFLHFFNNHFSIIRNWAARVRSIFDIKINSWLLRPLNQFYATLTDTASSIKSRAFFVIFLKKRYFLMVSNFTSKYEQTFSLLLLLTISVINTEVYVLIFLYWSAGVLPTICSPHAIWYRLL